MKLVTSNNGVYEFEDNGRAFIVRGETVEDAEQKATVIAEIDKEAELPLIEAKTAKLKALDNWLKSNYVDTTTGFEFPVSREDRQSLNEYESLLDKAKDAGQITDETANAIFPVGTDGTDTITLPDLKGLLLRYGFEILTRQKTYAVKSAQINACTTVEQVNSIEI